METHHTTQIYRNRRIAIDVRVVVIAGMRLSGKMLRKCARRPWLLCCVLRIMRTVPKAMSILSSNILLKFPIIISTMYHNQVQTGNGYIACDGAQRAWVCV